MKLKTWKGYNLIDILLITIGLVSVVASSIVFKSSWVVLAQSVLCLLTVFTQAKGKVITQIFGILTFIFYIYTSYSKQLYGEAILYLVILLPMYVYGLIHWLAYRDKDEKVVIVRSNLSKKEWLVFLLSFVCVSVGVYYLLKALNTAQLIVSTLSFISMLPAMYLLMRRCKWNQVAFLLNDLFVPILWLVLVINGDLSFISVVICFVFQLVYDIYGIFEWIKLEKKQNNQCLGDKPE